MQLRALIKTRRRKWAMIVLGIVVCAAAVWLLLDAGHKPTDEEKFYSMMRSRDWAGRFYRLEWHLGSPAPLRGTLRKLGERSSARFDRLREELVASGYLLTFSVTNDDFDTLTVPDELGATSFWTLDVQSNVIFMTCRTNDVARFRALIERKP